MKATEIRILIIDAHPIIRDGLANLLAPPLRCKRVTGCGGFAEAWERVESDPFDLVVSDFHVSGQTVLPFLGLLEKKPGKARCLIYSGADELQVGYPCIRAGAAGFVSKSAPMDLVVDAAKAVLSGRQFVSQTLARLLIGHQGGKQPVAGIRLSQREIEIFSMLGSGMTVSQIGKRLGISVKTVETHRENIKNKLGCTNASQVVAAAARWLDETSVSI